MADNPVALQSATPATLPDGTKPWLLEGTGSGDAGVLVAPTVLALNTGAEGARTFDIAPGDAANGIDVDVTRVQGTVNVAGSVEVANDAGNPLPVSGTVEITNDVGNPIPVSGTVGVSGAVEVTNDAGNPLPVSGTVEVANDAGNPLPVSGTVEITNDVGNAIPVSGPLTDTQLRAAAVAISAGSIKQQWAARVALTLTGLASLANGSSWQSDGLNLAASGALDVVLRFQLNGSGAGNTSVVNVYAAAALDDTSYVDGASGSAGAFSATRLNARFVGQVALNGTTAVIGALTLAQAFDGSLPQRFALILTNNSGAALAASGLVIEYQLVTGACG